MAIPGHRTDTGRNHTGQGARRQRSPAASSRYRKSRPISSRYGPRKTRTKGNSKLEFGFFPSTNTFPSPTPVLHHTQQLINTLISHLLPLRRYTTFNSTSIHGFNTLSNLSDHGGTNPTPSELLQKLLTRPIRKVQESPTVAHPSDILLHQRYRRRAAESLKGGRRCAWLLRTRHTGSSCTTSPKQSGSPTTPRKP